MPMYSDDEIDAAAKELQWEESDRTALLNKIFDRHAKQPLKVSGYTNAPPIANDDDEVTAAEIKEALRALVKEKAGTSISVFLSTDVETFTFHLMQYIAKSREYKHGEIVQDATGSLWQRYNQGSKTGWVTFGDDHMYSDSYPKRPLERIDMSED